MNIDLQKRDLQDRYDDTVQSSIPAFKARRKTDKCRDNMINYFMERQTNTKSEVINDQSQRLVANNFGSKGRDFYLQADGPFSQFPPWKVKTTIGYTLEYGYRISIFVVF